MLLCDTDMYLNKKDQFSKDLENLKQK